MRLAPDARDLLDREVERTGRYPAALVSDLIRLHFSPGPDRRRPPRVADAAAQ